MSNHVMSWLVILNIVLNAVTILALLWHTYLHRLGITIDRTFWRKVPFGLTLMWWNEQRTGGRGVYWFRWRNPDRIVDYPPPGTRGNP